MFLGSSLLLASGCGAVNVGSSIFSGSASAAPERELPGTRGWRVAKQDLADPDFLSAYASRVSIRPGETLDLYVSTQASSFRVAAVRLGNYQGVGGRVVAEYDGFDGQSQSGPQEDGQTRAVSADWTSTAELDTEDWPEGFYVLAVRAGGKGTYIPLVVRSADARGRVAIVTSATTWQAYNEWGGRSLYTQVGGDFSGRSYAVSFDRPFDGSGDGSMLRHEAPVAEAAERAGIDVAWLTNIDVAQNPSVLDGAAGVVSTGHDEYWPADYRRGLEAARAGGSNLAFLGANSGYWRVRLEDTKLGEARLVVCYKDGGIDPRSGSPDTTARWRDSPAAQPEVRLIGQQYDAFPVRGPMVIRDPDFFLFRDLNVSRGKQYPGLVGTEIDRVYPGSDTPRPIQVPTLSPVTCRGVGTWSTSSYYTTGSGSGVFATGTMDWVRAVAGPNSAYGITSESSRFAAKVTERLLAEMAKGPLAERFPAHDELDEVGLPGYNTSGAA